MTTRSVPWSSKCVAKLWRREWGVHFAKPAAAAALASTCRTVSGQICPAGVRPANSRVRGPVKLPVDAQHLQQPGRQQGIALLVAFAAYPQHHALGVDVRHPQLTGFTDP